MRASCGISVLCGEISASFEGPFIKKVMTASASSEQVPPARQRRLVGIDLARFLAVLGMFNVHLGVPFTDDDEFILRVFEASSGYSTALFTFLAGVSLAMLSGRQQVSAGRHLREARKRIAIRAVLMILLGLVLAYLTDATGFLLTVIIAFYGTYFLMALPFLGLRPRGLLIAAGTVALVGPQLSFVLRTWITNGTPLSRAVAVIDTLDPGRRLVDLGVLDTLLLGFYPATSYFALVLAGMAVGRLDLHSTALRVRLAAAGLPLAYLCYSLSDHLLRVIGVWPEDVDRALVPVERPELLLSAMAHTGTTFELLGSLGIALTVLAACLAVADRAGRVLFPLTAAGSMALTLYVVHALVLAWQVVVGGWPLSGVAPDLAELAMRPPGVENIPDLPAFPADGHVPEGVVGWLNTYMPEVFLISSLVFATIWRLLFHHGPLEGVVSESIRRLSKPGAPLAMGRQAEN